MLYPLAVLAAPYDRYVAGVIPARIDPSRSCAPPTIFPLKYPIFATFATVGFPHAPQLTEYVPSFWPVTDQM
jgi:hypothetical protein